MSDKIRVTIWNEFKHEQCDADAMEVYPNGIHMCIKEFLDKNEDMEVTAVTLGDPDPKLPEEVRHAMEGDPDQGLPDELLNNTDVLVWWGHVAHWKVKDELVDKIAERVYRQGMGFVGLHSAHHSKPMRKMLGCTGDLSWGDNMKEVVWNMLPTHPIAEGIPEAFTLESEELYSEPFFIPVPDEQVFTAWFEGGNVFRAGNCYYKGAGKVFYFQPGHETCRSFYNPYVQKIITNGIRWAAPAKTEIKDISAPHVCAGYFCGKKDY